MHACMAQVILKNGTCRDTDCWYYKFAEIMCVLALLFESLIQVNIPYPPQKAMIFPSCWPVCLHEFQFSGSEIVATEELRYSAR